MRLSTEARSARKQAQLARLDKKGDADYPTLYASTPHEMAKAARLGAERAATRAVQTAADELASSDAAGAAAVFGGGIATAAGEAE